MKQPRGSSESPRLLEQGGEEGELLRTLLRSAERDDPNAEQLQRLVAELDRALGPDAAEPSPEGESPEGDPSAAGALGEGAGVSTAATGGVAKGWLVAGLAVAVGAAVWAIAQPPAPSKKPPAAHSTLDSGESQVVSERAPPDTDQDPPVTRIEPETAPREEATAPPALTAEAPPPSPAAARPTEIELLSRAQSALQRREGTTALVLTREHRHTFPRGLYREEMDRIAIEALLQLGQRAEAELRAARFLERFPRSVHRQRVEALLGAEPSGPSR